jgi:hypothetical protein
VRVATYDRVFRSQAAVCMRQPDGAQAPTFFVSARDAERLFFDLDDEGFVDVTDKWAAHLAGDDPRQVPPLTGIWAEDRYGRRPRLVHPLPAAAVAAPRVPTAGGATPTRGTAADPSAPLPPGAPAPTAPSPLVAPADDAALALPGDADRWRSLGVPEGHRLERLPDGWLLHYPGGGDRAFLGPLWTELATLERLVSPLRLYLALGRTPETKAAVMERAGVSQKVWERVSRVLHAAGLLARTGRARQTRYWRGDGQPGAAPAKTAAATVA